MWITIFIRFVIKCIAILNVQAVFVKEIDAELGQSAVLEACCTVYKRFCLSSCLKKKKSNKIRVDHHGST